MASKKLCLDCRKCFNMSHDDVEHSNCTCPECGNQAMLITHRFRPPKKDDTRRWEVVEYLIANGFPYQHVSIYEPDRHGIQRFVSYGKYPESMIDAVEFVNRFKKQAIKPIGITQIG